MSDARSLERTGHALEYWFDVLDRFGAVGKGHTAAARHLHESHGIDGWYAQGITVAYERERGVRQLHQRCDGAFEVSVSKVVRAIPREVMRAFADKRARRTWAAPADASIAAALATAFGKAGPAFRVRPDGLARTRFTRGDTKVEITLMPRPGDKTSVVASLTKLPDAGAVEAHRTEWRRTLAALAEYLGAR